MRTNKVRGITVALLLATGVVSASPAQAQAPADRTTTQYEARDDGFDMGWLGLIGLAGLLGLKRRDRADYNAGATPRTTR